MGDKFKVGDKVVIISKSVSVPLQKSNVYPRCKENGYGYITRIYGDPYNNEIDEDNCIVVNDEPPKYQLVGGDFFAPQDLVLLDNYFEVGMEVVIDVPLNHIHSEYNGERGVIRNIASNIMVLDVRGVASLTLYDYEVTPII